jgi:hypothetical protein
MIPPGLDKWGSVRELSKRQAKALVPKLEIMSARDAAKLQDIPQWYAFDGPRSAVFNQIGMGVPVNMGRSVIRWVRRSMGLPVRQPWWKTQTSPLFETWPRRVPLGLWPLEAMDPCMAFPGVLEGAVYSHEQAIYDWSEIEEGGMLGEDWETRTQDRFERTGEALRPLTRQAEARTRAAGQQTWELFPDGYIDGEALWQSGWRPRSPYDAPQPFDDVGWFSEYLRQRSVEPGWYNVWAMLYRTRFPGFQMDATSTTNAGPIESVWAFEPSAFPSNAPFTRAQIQAAMRGEKIQVRKAPRRQRPTVDLDALIARFKS